MRQVLTFLFLILNFSGLFGQIAPQHPDLGLNGQVTWLSDTRIRVEYDWSADSQLLDWVATKKSTLVRGNNTLTITGGSASVRSMEWKQLIKCSKIIAVDAKAINSSVAHLNFITNVLGWSGYEFNPAEVIGAVYKANGNIWIENGSVSIMQGPVPELGKPYMIELNITDTQITAKSSSNNNLYVYTLTSPPDMERQVAVGGWGGDTEWGKLTIEGEVVLPPEIPSDMINIQSIGSVFAPVIEVTGNPVIEWVFDDSTLSSSNNPTKDYGSIGLRHNYLRVTPWTALVGINVGYDAGDGGYGDFAMVSNQNVSGFQNLQLVKSSLQYICASHNPLIEIDLRGFESLRIIEFLACTNLSKARLGTHPVLERICFENCNLDTLDLSGCPALEDLRASRNNYTTINWGSSGAALWHLCVRSNPQLTENIGDLSRFPVLRELLTWDDNQTGDFVCHNPVIERIDSYDNHYTTADVSGCTNLRQLTLSGSELATLDIGTAEQLNYLRLKDCKLTEAQVNYVLTVLDEAGLSDGYLDIKGNAGPTAKGYEHMTSLENKGWDISAEPVTGIIDDNKESIKTVFNGNEIRIFLNNSFLDWNASLFNMNGIRLIENTVDSDILVFDVSSMASGVYIIVLSGDGQRETIKVALTSDTIKH